MDPAVRPFWFLLVPHVGCRIVDADPELVAALDQDARGGELDVVVEPGSGKGRLRDAGSAQCG